MFCPFNFYAGFNPNIGIKGILHHYAQGFFLMADGDDESQLSWYSSALPTMMPLDERFCYPRSLRRVLNQNQFQVAINRDFIGVMEGCAYANRESTWISLPLMEVYWQLHQAGWAHSFETWQGEQLAGGLLGIAIGGVFIGESMFYHIPNGSKVALVKLVEHLRSRQFTSFDVQMVNSHLVRFGADFISKPNYHNQLRQGLRSPSRFTDDAPFSPFFQPPSS
ncbi:leucyl/phenylalanyl-tRNA--protein transferase [Candidatus Synechococcus calcipolaris G9]|uniref:Leucyl/phenylalanyl-tRNA--protein transferase n=1 Tax=Candidatus Synechococcus calcipolaris G9 TaxID=1497997 RepID=A0ABT6EWW2_9SYNE|nr:leucyl/phenylalanyl-tRNA--protein transferase [Candidatus Synechococcus calcipolaris]MDG2990212.1 leucyl/phenylalanyl-tRNA--protein transferase [Candidatus Synechococcus calcipolaris G9]